MNKRNPKSVVVIIWILIALYFLLFSGIAWRKYVSFSFHDIDLSILNQTFWNTIHGRIVCQSLGQATILNGGHVFFIIFGLAPLYALFSSPLTLLFLQSLALALGAWPVYLLARDLINPFAGLLFAICYLIYPPLNYVNLFEFHPIAFATPLLLFMFYFYIKNRWLLFCLFMALSLFCREDVAIPVFAMGAFALTKNWLGPRKISGANLKWGLVPIFSAIVWFILCVKFIQPYFIPVALKQTAVVKGGFTFYSWLGNSPSEVIKTVISHPGKVLQGILIKPKLLYMLHLFVPVAFLPLFSPSALVMTLLSLSEGLLSQRFTHFSIKYQYSSIIIPFVFISSIYGVRNILRLRWTAGKEKIIFATILLFSLISAKALGPLFNLPEAIKQWKVTQEDIIRDKLIEKIPPQAPVITTFEFAPKLSRRPQIFYFYQVYAVSRIPDFGINIPVAQEVARYALIDFNDPLTFYDFYTPEGDEDVYKFLTEGNWELAKTVNSIALFRKGKEADLGLIEKADRREIEQPLNVIPLPQMKLAGYSLKKARVMGGRVIELDVYFQCLEKVPANFLINVRFNSNRKPEFSFQQPFFGPYRIYPSSRWSPGEVVKQKCNILIPEGAPSGDYDLTLALLVQKGRGFEGKIIYRAPKALSLP